MFTAWTNNLSDYEDDGYSDVDEEESDEEFNQKAEGISNSCSRIVNLSGSGNKLGKHILVVVDVLRLHDFEVYMSG